MIDLCVDARMADSSGIGTCIKELVPLLNQPPFRVILLVRKQEESWGRGMDQILFSAPIYSIQEQAAYPFKIPKCDLFWSPHYNVPLLPIRAKKRVVTIHDACHLAQQAILSLPERIYARRVMRQAFHRSNAVVTDSFFSQKELIRFLGKPKRELLVISPAIDLEKFRKRDDLALKARIRAKYRLPEKFILFVGNLKVHKNLKGLLLAFNDLTLPEWGVAVVGKSDGLRNKEIRTERTQIHYLGEVPGEDLPVLYELAALFVFPSFYEGFGFPPLEAMGCGCPTIASRAASLPEVCGDACLYIDPASPRMIAEAIQKIISNENIRAELVQKGFERVKIFNWVQTAEKYRNLFERVIYA
jgi:glycosyltransferase involved in cell wall biosynthesis